MNEYKVRPLSGKGQDIFYMKEANGISVKWGELTFFIENSLYNKILNEFFIDSDKWYMLGASMTEPTKGGLGEYITENCYAFSPRHASAIAAIMVSEKHLMYKGIKPIELKRVI